MMDATDWRALVGIRLTELGMLRRELAEALGRAESWLSHLMSGLRELDPAVVPDLARALRLDAEATQHLAVLVDLRSRSGRARRAAVAALRATQLRRAPPSEDLQALATHLIAPAILELARCEDFRLDPAWIGAVLVPVVPEAEVREILTTLSESGLLTGDLCAAEGTVPPAALTELVTIEAALQLALTASRSTALSERQFAVLPLAISEEHAPRLAARVQEMLQELVLLASEDPGPRNRVVQVQLQLFPVSLFTDAHPPGLPQPEE